MALSPSSIPSVSDMENFATEYLGLEGSDFDMYYESYYNLDSDSYEEELSKDELTQTEWEYWYKEGSIPLFLCLLTKEQNTVRLTVSRTNPNSMLKVLLEHYPYRYVQMDKNLSTGDPDYRLQKWMKWIGWKDRYLFDNHIQMTTAMEDFEYTKLLSGDPSYVRDSIKNPNPWYYTFLDLLSY